MRRNLPATLLVLLMAAATLAGAPGGAAAQDCGADYIACIGTTGIPSSDYLHDEQCGTEYTRCISRLLLFF